MNENTISSDQRKSMLHSQLIARGIKDEKVLSAFLSIPREEFVLTSSRADAYKDYPIDIGYGQTISQPYMTALMTEILCLSGSETVLEIGTGSGYQAAILSMLCKKVFTLERIPQLAESAKRIFDKLELENITVVVKDGSCGLEEYSPYDSIIVTCAAPRVPEALKQQLAKTGKLLLPVGGRYAQELVLVENISGDFKETRFGNCVFVPLLGKYGWDNS
jgi:protein-L-isoaspartate(D-aspartate) O-methyltransferase